VSAWYRIAKRKLLAKVRSGGCGWDKRNPSHAGNQKDESPNNTYVIGAGGSYPEPSIFVGRAPTQNKKVLAFGAKMFASVSPNSGQHPKSGA
jgi:hypothetical protein